MFVLVITVLLSSPIPEILPPQLLRCTAHCLLADENYKRCDYTLRPKCGRREIVCVESDAVECVPTIVNLGEWSPTPQNYSPQLTGDYHHFPETGLKISE